MGKKASSWAWGRLQGWEGWGGQNFSSTDILKSHLRDSEKQSIGIVFCYSTKELNPV